jgi:hypothetical protein
MTLDLNYIADQQGFANDSAPDVRVVTTFQTKMTLRRQ